MAKPLEIKDSVMIKNLLEQYIKQNNPELAKMILETEDQSTVQGIHECSSILTREAQQPKCIVLVGNSSQDTTNTHLPPKICILLTFHHQT